MRQASAGIRKFVFLAAIAAMSMAVVDTGEAQDLGTDLVERLRARLTAAGSLSADFTQTFSSEFFEDTESSSGRVVLQGSKYRVETLEQTFVSDGVTTWIHDRAADQVLINDYTEDETSFSLSRFLLNDSGEYEAKGVSQTTLGGVALQAVRLESTDPLAFFPECTLYVRAQGETISRLEVVDLNGTRISFELRNVVLGPRIAPGTFSFDPAAVGDVVDLRSS